MHELVLYDACLPASEIPKAHVYIYTAKSKYYIDNSFSIIRL